ncbi:hypothetical protein M378DRAFT_169165 [Amanita muscaria Koide BX008]|uniref:AB hydrolase-1 domain-containing protein n=1 Tax=Amanita muscaria (strain Koide BX008) TaxID=946122 RepID=A0A0C2SZH2_AMAMK|nr:hypothetical protein M378DRAFT_169165 [Amanita muscaria Koide BX008]
MACILKHAGVDDVICMGHDWGSQICYEMARARPDITNAVIGISIPYAPGGDTFTPSTSFVKYYPKLMYQVYFDEKTDNAAAELDKDVRRSLRSVHRTLASPVPDAFLRSRDSFLTAFGSEEIPPIPYLTPQEEDYLVEQFKVQGFENTLHFYITENRYQSWKFVHNHGNRSIPQPVLTVYSSKDSTADWKFIGTVVGSAKYVPNLTTETVTADHWAHLENPIGFNPIVRGWLSKLRDSGMEKKAKAVDEL